MPKPIAFACVARSDDGHYSLRLHRDHDFPRLDYNGAQDRRTLRLSSAAFGRLLRELSPDLALTVDVVKLRPIVGAFPAGELTAILVLDGRSIIAAHVPALLAVNDGRRLLAIIPELRALALGHHLLSASDERDPLFGQTNHHRIPRMIGA